MSPAESSARPVLSVVIPVYGAEASLGPLVERLVAVFATLDYTPEIICVDDRSRDRSWAVLLELKARYPDLLKIVRMQQNVGQHSATCCGFGLCEGDVVIIMDDDLQNPPEEIPKLVAAIEKGYDLAIGAYDAKKHSAGRNLGGRAIDAVLRRIFRLPKDFQLTSFRAVRGGVVARVANVSTPFPYVTALLFSNATTYTNVPVHHASRAFGTSNYTLRNSVALALNLLLNYSSVPLKVVGGMVGFSMVLTLVFGLMTLYQAVTGQIGVQGWATTIVLICLLGAQSMMSMLIVLIYVTRINYQLNVPVPKQQIEEFHA